MDTAECCYPKTDWQGEQIVYKELQGSAEEHKSTQSSVHSVPGGLSHLRKKMAVVCAGFISFLVTNNSPDRTEQCVVLW